MKRVDPEQLVRDIWNLACGPYPDRPGAKERGGTSEESANAIAPLAADLRGKFAKHFFETHPLTWTADECADRFQVSPFSARPRISELRNAGLIKPSGERRRNRTSTHFATAWIATDLLVGTDTDGVTPPLIPDAAIDGGAS
ncbi:hypothetical protein SAMN05216330_104447 [Bradyrhizobium sp. Ghvi]|nr:hypothetical protein SAMN05216330_104447 [Bradyrhizobium sp. Ghvi]